jgi:transcriptional regulator with XRE-family HTH domain
VRDQELARAIRAVRQQRGWRQADVARRAGLSRERVSDLEHGDLGSFPVHTLRRIGAALDIDISLLARWRGGELSRLLDADHASLQNLIAHRFVQAAWTVIPERTFSRYGERGSIDLLAFHRPTGTVAVVELKTVIADIQELLARLDAKARLAPGEARALGWGVSSVVPCLFVADTTTSRRRLGAHQALFARFTVRGAAVRAWIKSPSPATGVLAVVALPYGNVATGRRAGRQRVRVIAVTSRRR